MLQTQHKRSAMHLGYPEPRRMLARSVNWTPDEKWVRVCEAPFREKVRGLKVRLYASLGTIFR